MPLLPFVEQQALWEQISNPYAVKEPASAMGLIFAAMGPQVAMTLANHGQFQYDPWLTEIPTYRCPSDPGVGFQRRDAPIMALTWAIPFSIKTQAGYSRLDELIGLLLDVHGKRVVGCSFLDRPHVFEMCLMACRIL